MTLRDPGLLASAAARPATTVSGQDAYPTFAEQAAALMHSPAHNHALLDGNKRLAWAATRVFCLLDCRGLRFAVDEASPWWSASPPGPSTCRRSLKPSPVT